MADNNQLDAPTKVVPNHLLEFETRIIKNGVMYSKMQGIGQLFWYHAARQLAKAARQHGFVVRIDQFPCEPLAMGNHRDVVTVYPIRK